MVAVGRQGEWYIVTLDEELLGQFVHLLDAHCFAMQLMERGVTNEVRLLSGVIVPR